MTGDFIDLFKLRCKELDRFVQYLAMNPAGAENPEWSRFYVLKRKLEHAKCDIEQRSALREMVCWFSIASQLLNRQAIEFLLFGPVQFTCTKA